MSQRVNVIQSHRIRGGRDNTSQSLVLFAFGSFSRYYLRKNRVEILAGHTKIHNRFLEASYYLVYYLLELLLKCETKLGIELICIQSDPIHDE